MIEIDWNTLAWWGCGYTTIGFFLWEGIRWSLKRWRMKHLPVMPSILVYTAWPLIILLAIYLAWRER